MRRARSTRHVVFLRRFLLFAALALVVGVGALFWMGRTRPSSEDTATSANEEPLAENALTYEARGFDHTVSIGDRPIFRIQAAKTSTTGEGETPRLQKVTLTYYREGGEEYKITSERGQYDLKTEAADLEGQVMVVAPDGLTLRTQGLKLSQNADWLVSSAAVQLSMGDSMRGRAQGLRANLKDSVFILQKDVVLSGTSDAGQPLALRSRRLSYDRHDRLIRAEGSVLLRYGDDLIHAGRIGAFLDPSEKNLHFVNARWKVQGELHSQGPDGTQTSPAPSTGPLTRFSGNALLLEFNPTSGDLKQLELDGDGQTPAWIIQNAGSGVLRRIQSAEIDGGFVDGRLAHIETPSETELRSTSEVRGQRLSRRSKSGRLKAKFSKDGALAQAQFQDGVEFSDGDRTVAGDSGEYKAATDSMTVLGDPATATSDRRIVTAPRLEYTIASGTAHAEGGVRVRFRPGSGVSLPNASDSDAQQPVQVEATTLDSDTRAQTFRLDGKVRAWQGENYLLAESLTGSDSGETLIAEGKVKTVWKQPGRDEDGTATTPQTIDASGSRLEYARGVRHMTYFGPAAVRQGSRRMTCDRIDAQLDDHERARQMTCLGSVEIRDPTTGRRATGDRADYDVGSGLVRVTGEPVTLRHGDGSEVNGALLIYNLDDGTATIESTASESGDSTVEPATGEEAQPGGEQKEEPPPAAEAQSTPEATS